MGFNCSGPGNHCDVLVVGARCAGAPLAMKLSLAGARVVLIDSAELPSDKPLSTHFVQPYGMAILEELGLAERIREIAPPITLSKWGLEDYVIPIRFDERQGSSAIRRIDLDSVLLRAAYDAGAEVRPQTKLVELLRDGERVSGAVVQSAGKRNKIRCDVVVGADGANSTVARQVGASEYHGYDSPRALYWAYWPRPDWYATDARYGGGSALLYRGDNYSAVFPTNRDQLLIGYSVPIHHGATRVDRERSRLFEWLRKDPFTAPLTRSEPLSKPLGFVKGRFFFRQAAGPGWALVGDAGLHKDPTPGFGISDALRDARALSDAIIAGGDAALHQYWRDRDVQSIELYHFARQLGEPGYNNPMNRAVYRKVAGDPKLAERISKVLLRELSPFKAFTTAEVSRWTVGAMARGRVQALAAFVRAGRYADAVEKELRHMEQLAAAARRPLDEGARTRLANDRGH